MPVIPQQETIVQYIANSAQLAYTFAFYAPLATDIEVFYQSSTAVPIPTSDILTLNIDYTVAFNADPITGGTITLLFTPTTGFYITINRQVLASLTTNFSNAQNFNGANLDAALDRLLLLCQQNQNYALQRNLSYVINTYLPDAVPFTQLPPLPQNFVWIGSASGVIAAEIATDPSASVLQSMLASNGLGTDGARLVGYYDAETAQLSTTVHDYLDFLPSYINSQIQTAVQNSSQIYGVDTGSVNNLTVALTPTLTAYQIGQQFIITPANTNTGNTNIDIDGLGGKTVTVLGANIKPGDIVQNVNAWVSYDGTNMQLLNPQTLLNRKFAGSYMTMSGGVTVGTLSAAKLTFNNTIFDTNSWNNTGSNRMVPNMAGYVRVNATVLVHDSGVTAVQGDVEIAVYKNGAPYAVLGGAPVTGFSSYVSGDAIVPVNGTTDFLEIYGLNENNVRSMTFGSQGIFQAEYLGR